MTHAGAKVMGVVYKLPPPGRCLTNKTNKIMYSNKLLKCHFRFISVYFFSFFLRIHWYKVKNIQVLPANTRRTGLGYKKPERVQISALLFLSLFVLVFILANTAFHWIPTERPSPASGPVCIIHTSNWIFTGPLMMYNNFSFPSLRMCMKLRHGSPSPGTQMRLRHVSTQAQNSENRFKYKKEESSCNLLLQLETIPQILNAHIVFSLYSLTLTIWLSGFSWCCYVSIIMSRESYLNRNSSFCLGF